MTYESLEGCLLDTRPPLEAADDCMPVITTDIQCLGIDGIAQRILADEQSRRASVLEEHKRYKAGKIPITPVKPPVEVLNQSKIPIIQVSSLPSPKRWVA